MDTATNWRYIDINIVRIIKVPFYFLYCIYRQIYIYFFILLTDMDTYFFLSYMLMNSNYRDIPTLPIKSDY